MSAVEQLELLGGLATRRTLVARVGRSALERAVAGNDIVRCGRGRYALPQIPEALRMAARLNGVLSLTSAALGWGWEVKHVPVQPHVTVPVKRRLDPRRSHGVVLHRADLMPDQVRGLLTSPEVTLEQCLRRLPFDEALAVADSALRNGFSPAALAGIARHAAGPGSPQIRKVAGVADGLAANPFESVLRAIALAVPGLQVRPQRLVVTGARPDLVDEQLRIVLEADSFTWHGNRKALAADCRRYNRLVAEGWLVLRFCYEDVMFHADEVTRVLVAAVAVAQARSEVSFRPGVPA